MAILGLTHSEDGSPIQRLPVSIKVAIGEGPDPDNPKSHPEKLDHFVFKQKTLENDKAVWAEHEEVTQRYGEEPREIGIVFMDDNLDNVFRTSYAWWTQTECKCQGQMVKVEDSFVMEAIRRTERNPDGEAWPGTYKYSSGAKKGQAVEPCGDGCPDLEAGKCKPSADLYFQLDKFPMLGAVCRLHTTSYRSIRQIASALDQVRNTFGGLAGVRMMLKVRPHKGVYSDAKGVKHTTTLYILSLELDAEDWKKLLTNATEMKRLFDQQRRAFGGRRIEILEDDAERAPEIAREFHPQIADSVEDDKPAIQQPARASAAPPPAPVAAPVVPPAVIPPEQIWPKFWPKEPVKTNGNGAGPPAVIVVDKDQVTKLRNVAVERGYSPGQKKDILREFWGVENFAQIPAAKFTEVFEYFDSSGMKKPVFEASDEDIPELFRR